MESYYEIFKIFCIAEQIFEKKETETCYNKIWSTRGNSKLANFLKLKNENEECTKRGVAGGLSELIYFLEICLYLFFCFFLIIILFFYLFLLAFYFRILILYTTDFNPRINKDIFIYSYIH